MVYTFFGDPKDSSTDVYVKAMTAAKEMMKAEGGKRTEWMVAPTELW